MIAGPHTTNIRRSRFELNFSNAARDGLICIVCQKIKPRQISPFGCGLAHLTSIDILRKN